MRVLCSAYVCAPGLGSEHGVGWAWLRGLSARFDLTLLTDVAFRDAIECEREYVRPFRAVYIDVSAHRRRWYPGLDVFPHYHAWQRRALAVARALHDGAPFDLVHHVTYGSHRLPTELWRLDAPFVWGPVGGGEGVHPRFYAPWWLGVRGATREFVRSASNAWCRVDPQVQRTALNASVIGASTPETLAAFPEPARRRGVIMAKTVVDAEDLASLAEAKGPPPQDGMAVLFVGRLLGWKGAWLAIRAFRRYAEARPAARLRLYGDGPHRPQLERLAAREGIADRVEFMGRCPREEVLRAYASHHVFLFPTLHDSYPTAATEAMASGLPVLCVDVGGMAVMVPDEAGVKVSPTTVPAVVESLARGLAQLNDDPRRWRSASAAARARALDPRSTPTIDDMIDTLYGPTGLLEDPP